ncbi:Sugar/inositol transporter [Trema orientale]|uniref:Sugar/inositol transporter n=1 Tax=Trema orientale TaxID=63057 RepID=A0A2P5BM76_TREOI|nr:Sugar/inositol transporter [Trema orientale]
MSRTSSQHPNKDHPYHPLPAPDSEPLLSPSSEKVVHLKEDDRTRPGTTPSLEDIEVESQEHKHNISEGSPPSSSSSSSSHGRSARINGYALAGAILASTNSVLLGYDIGVMSGAVLFIKEDLRITSTQVEILVGSLNVCSLIGSLASGKTSDSIGRRYTIILAAATFLIGAVLMGLAPSFPFLLAGRLIAGIGVGYSLMIAPVYVAELSPTLTRGFLTSLPEVFINVGILLGYISNYALSGLPETLNWRLMLGLAAIPAVAVAIGVSAMPESPRWLVMRGRREEAKRVLVRTSESKEEAELRLAEIVKAASFHHASSSPSSSSSSSEWYGQGVWFELIFRPSRPIRRILIAAIGVNFFMQASGNDAVVYYSPEVFRDAGIENRKQQVGVTVIMGLAKTSFVLISALYLDRFGRRPLLLLGSVGMALSLAGLGLGSKYLEYSNGKPVWAIVLCVVAVCSAVSFFSIGLGPITWVYSSEIFPLRFRAQGSSLAISVNRLVSGLVSMTFLSISREITFGGVFFALSGVMVVGTIFFYFFLPETKGKSLEEIEALFEDQVENDNYKLRPS